MNRLVVYSSPACRPCKMAKDRLAAAGVPYEEVDVSEDVEAAQRLRQAGLQQTPVFGWAGELHTIVALRDIITQAKEGAPCP